MEKRGNVRVGEYVRGGNVQEEMPLDCGIIVIPLGAFHNFCASFAALDTTGFQCTLLEVICGIVVCMTTR